MTSPALVLVVPCYNEASRLVPEAFLPFTLTHPATLLVFGAWLRSGVSG